MSLETLLLFALFILVPLIQRLLQAARQGEGAQRTPERADRPPSRTAQIPRPARPAPPPPIPSRPTAAPEVAADAMIAPGPLPAREAAAPAAHALMPRQSTRRSTAVASLRGRRNLRRAVLLKEILGPCRAVNPYDWPQDAVRH